MRHGGCPSSPSRSPAGASWLPTCGRHREEVENLSYVGVASRHEVAVLLRSARVALAPALWQEPGGLSVLEAMSCGTQVVAYASGGLREYVGDAGAGRVVSPGAGHLADACLELHDDRSAWSECSERAVAAVQERHDVVNYVDRLEDIYERAGKTDREHPSRLHSRRRRGS